MSDVATSRDQVLSHYRTAMNDQEALLNDPEGYIARLIEQVKEAAKQGVISAEDLREQLEWAEAAQAWAIEELLTRELNG